MKLLLLVLLLSATLASAEFYKVSVTRKAENVYKVEDVYPTVYVITRYCYEYAYAETAILQYERYGYDNKLVFDSGTECAVEALR